MIRTDWRGIKYDVTLIEYCLNDKFIEGLHLYSFLRLLGHRSAGYVREWWLVSEFSKKAGYSERKTRLLLRNLKKRGWVMKLGKYYHATSINRIKNQITHIRPELHSCKSERLAWRDIVIDKKVFKANCVEYVKAKGIRARYWYERQNGILDVEKSASAEADNSYTRDYNFGDFSFRLASQYTGLSIGHLHDLSKIQTISTYHKRYCPEFDKANIKSLDDIKEYVKSANAYGENLAESMFEYCRVMLVNPFTDGKFYKAVLRYRRRLSDYIATTAEIVNRKANKKDKRKTIDGLYRLIPSTKSGVRDLNNIIDYYNTTIYSNLNTTLT